MDCLPYGILLKHVIGFKKKDNKFKIIKPVTVYDEQGVLIPEGTIVVALSQAESTKTEGIFDPPHNYRCTDPSITLHCTSTEVKQLTCKQKDLLMGVNKLDSRLEILSKLDWVDTLDIDALVYVTIPTITVPVQGIIRFIGTIPEEIGTKFAIELLERRGEGASDGTFQDVKYFECEHNCAVFVSMDNLTTKHVAKFAAPLKSTSHDSPPLLKSTLHGNPITLKDKVKMFDKHGNPVCGIVKWIGKNQGINTLGIEVEKVVVLTDFNEHIQDEKYQDCFTVADDHSKLLLPAHLVTKEDTNVGNDIKDNPLQSLNKQQVDSSDDKTSEKPLSEVVAEKTPSAIKQPKYLTQKRGSEQQDNAKEWATLSASCKPASKEPISDNPHNFKVGAKIQFGDPPCYGAIKWIGSLPGYGCLMAGVEVEKPLTTKKKDKDGWYEGVKYFRSKTNKGHFLPLVALHLDERQQAKVQNRSKSVDNGTAVNDITRLNDNLTLLESQVKKLQSTHGEKLIAIESTIDHLHRNESSVNVDFQSAKEQIKTMEVNITTLTQKVSQLQTTNEELSASNVNLQNQVSVALQQLLDMVTINKQLQTSNSELQTSKANLQDCLTDIEKHLQAVRQSNVQLQTQLSLTQQQLIGVQSMMTHSRLWAVSDDQFSTGKEIGRGAWATVHETTFRGTIVAAKCLHNIINTPETREMFQQEMEMILHCQHENIVTLIGATLEDNPVILMELMDINLRNAYEQGSVKDHQKFGIFYDVAKALHFLHTRPDPVIHRDVSSANVLLKDCGNVKWLAKLGDLGTAKIQQHCTTPGPGTMAYAAPEVAYPTQHSPKMDVYSYGILIVETLTEAFPFKKMDILKAFVQEQFPQYHQLVTNCNSHQSSDRPTMYDVITQLDSIAATIS